MGNFGGDGGEFLAFVGFKCHRIERNSEMKMEKIMSSIVWL